MGNNIADLDVRPLSPALGAEISGLDLSQPLDDGTVAAIRSAWLDHLVIVFRSQTLSEQDQIRFCRQLGTVETYSVNRDTPLTDHPDEMLVISNLKENGRFLGTLSEGELPLHADGLWYEVPPRATALYAVEVPSRGGETLFCNLYAAYEQLPADLRAKLDGRNALFCYDLGSRPGSVIAGDAPDVRSHIHPAFARHPETGRPVITLNPLMSTEILGLPEAESRDALDRVFAHCAEDRFVYAHDWRPGDLLLWDNRGVLHGRRAFDVSERRYLKRVTIRGELAPEAA